MDFFGILFDMKNGKKIPYSKNYFDTLFAENLAGVTTLTGTLPLTFTTSETALRSWTIYGNNTAHIATSTAVLPLTFTTTEDKLRDWEIRGNDDVYEGQQGVGERTENLFDNQLEQGTVIASGDEPATNRVRYDTPVAVEANTVYSQSATAVDTSKTLEFIAMGFNGSIWGALFSGWKPLNTSFNTSSCVLVCMVYRFLGNTVITPADVTNVMLVKGSTAPSTYVPYGYEIPISVNGNAQTFYIGSTPLTAGQSISKTSTGVDIATTEGENTISTTLYNKPETAISYVDYLGVGEKSGNDWHIPLTISDGTNTTSVNVPIDAPLTEGQSVTDTQTINTFEGENTIDTMLTNKPQMTITYKGG